jgi:hypothetical protein
VKTGNGRDQRSFGAGLGRQTTDPAPGCLNVPSVTRPTAPDHPPPHHRVGRWVGPLALALMAMAATACGSDLIGPASTSTSLAAAPVTTSTTAPLTGEVAVAFPVVACTTPYGGQLPGPGWKPTILLAPIPTALVGQVEFYSDGTRSILGPSGWACTETTAADGGVDLAVVPPGTPNPATPGSPAAGANGIFATFDTTGHSAGVDLVCPFFTLPSFQQRDADCNGQKVPGEFSSMPTPDVASVLDPAGVVGTLAGSGGGHMVSGAVLFPQVMPAVTDGASIAIAVESCALSNAALCPTVVSDFEVREFPVPSPDGSSG